jgi:hypothetical protein
LFFTRRAGSSWARVEDTVLTGNRMPPLSELGIHIDPAQIAGRPLLVCQLDWQQRPSRQMLKQLVGKAGVLKDKGVAVLAIQISQVARSDLDAWLKTHQITFPIHIVEGDFEAQKACWGVKALPWLIVVDKEHVVRAEGFGLHELDQKLAVIADKP